MGTHTNTLKLSYKGKTQLELLRETIEKLTPWLATFFDNTLIIKPEKKQATNTILVCVSVCVRTRVHEMKCLINFN